MPKQGTPLATPVGDPMGPPQGPYGTPGVAHRGCSFRWNWLATREGLRGSWRVWALSRMQLEQSKCLGVGHFYLICVPPPRAKKIKNLIFFRFFDFEAVDPLEGLGAPLGPTLERIIFYDFLKILFFVHKASFFKSCDFLVASVFFSVKSSTGWYLQI